ncbi:MAG: hypothetical protein WAO23_02780 [Dethiobacteria bacterium]
MQKSKLLWKEQLGRLISSKRRSILQQDGASTERTGKLEVENKENHDFRAGIFYFKLSTLVDIDFTSEVVQEILDQIEIPENMYATLFLNNSINEIIHPHSMVERNKVVEIIRDYYEEYAEENELFSGIMEQLFPKHDLYANNFYPDHRDLGVIFTDRYGIEIDPSIEKDIRKMGANWLFICIDKYRPLEITELHELID